MAGKVVRFRDWVYGKRRFRRAAYPRLTRDEAIFLARLKAQRPDPRPVETAIPPLPVFRRVSRP